MDAAQETTAKLRNELHVARNVHKLQLGQQVLPQGLPEAWSADLPVSGLVWLAEVGRKHFWVQPRERACPARAFEKHRRPICELQC